MQLGLTKPCRNRGILDSSELDEWRVTSGEGVLSATKSGVETMVTVFNETRFSVFLENGHAVRGLEDQDWPGRKGG